MRINSNMNNYKALQTIIILLPLIILAGCQGNNVGMSEEAFKEQVVQTNLDIQTYTIDSEMTMKVDMLYDKTVTETLNIQRNDEGVMDRANNEYHLSTTQRVELWPGSQEESIDMYVVNDTTYVQYQGEWLNEIPGDFENNLEDPMKIWDWAFSSGKMNLREETITDTAYVVAHLQPNVDELQDYGIENMEVQELFPQAQETSNTFDTYNITVWIQEDTYFIERFEEQVRLEFNQSPNDTIIASSNRTFTISSINEPVHIELPEDAPR